MLFITHRLQDYFLNIRQKTSIYINALMQACLEIAVHAPPWVLINSRNFVNNCLFEFLNSHDTPPEHTVFQERPQEKIWYSKFGRPRRPSDVAETTNKGNTLLPITTLHSELPYEMASSPLPFLFPPTTTSYRAGAIIKFEMCQLAPRHPV